MSSHAGEIFSLLSALLWAFSFVLFKKSGESIPPLALNLFKNILSLALFGITFIAARRLFMTDASFSDYGILVVSGILGITIADTMLFYALNILGAGLTALVDCIYSPSVVFLAFLFLREKLTGLNALGALLILVAVATATTKVADHPHSREKILLGVLLGALSMFLMASAIVMAKPVLNRTPVLWATVVRLSGATVALALLLSLLPRRHSPWSHFRPGTHWKFSIPATFFGSYLSMTCWVSGMKYTLASVSAILNQMSTIFAVVFAALILKEPITKRKLLAVILAMAGALLVTLG